MGCGSMVGYTGSRGVELLSKPHDEERGHCEGGSGGVLLSIIKKKNVQ